MAKYPASWLGLSARSREVFSDPPLASVICQIRFHSVLSIAKAEFVSTFQELIRHDYPVTSSDAEQASLTIQLGGAPLPAVGPVNPPVLWRFSDVDGNWLVTLSTDFVAITTSKYHGFEDFLKRLTSVISALEQTIRPSLCTRVGLRYINEIRPVDPRWTDIISRDLLGPLAVPNFLANAEASLQQIMLEGPANEKVLIRHGVYPGGTTVEDSGWEQSQQPFYLLDFDVYREFGADNLFRFGQAELVSTVIAQNAVASELFRWSITDSYASQL